MTGVSKSRVAIYPSPRPEGTRFPKEGGARRARVIGYFVGCS